MSQWKLVFYHRKKKKEKTPQEKTASQRRVQWASKKGNTTKEKPPKQLKLQILKSTPLSMTYTIFLYNGNQMNRKKRLPNQTKKSPQNKFSKRSNDNNEKTLCGKICLPPLGPPKITFPFPPPQHKKQRKRAKGKYPSTILFASTDWIASQGDNAIMLHQREFGSREKCQSYFANHAFL